MSSTQWHWFADTKHGNTNKYLNGVLEMMDLVACFERVVVDCSIFLVHALFRAQQLGLKTRQFLLRNIKLAYCGSLTELQLHDVTMQLACQTNTTGR